METTTASTASALRDDFDPDGRVRGNPLLDDLDVRLGRIAPGECTLTLQIGERHLNRSGSLQGGVSATLLDAACGYAGLMTDAQAPLRHGVTVMLSVCYLGRVSAGRVLATGRVVRSGRSIFFCSGELVSEAGELIATAQGSFKRTAPLSRQSISKETRS
ncbi:PaaI family thioesterase [Variovorax sp. J22R133]|uniref:PaaI family thioesterase n=1 Tax=Variovorax brevis TaxID=3053503 RepID=UPI002576BAEE|nr:PaaI family thioesterase [Variovorax sp. J22R133]MDM0117022.1 PaaI family thioesterase [Variovorax sp. J22R133]